MAHAMFSAYLLSVGKLQPKISLTREVRKCRNEGKQSEETK